MSGNNEISLPDAIFQYIVLGVLPMVFIASSTYIAYRVYQESVNPCIIEYQSEPISGETIVHYNGAFSDNGLIRYYLNYRGKREFTGDECLLRICVTKGKYGRHMHSETNYE